MARKQPPPDKGRERKPNPVKASKQQVRRVERTERAARAGRHVHNDHGKTYTDHRDGKLVLITPCTCGHVMAVDPLED